MRVRIVPVVPREDPREGTKADEEAQGGPHCGVLLLLDSLSDYSALFLRPIVRNLTLPVVKHIHFFFY